MQILINILIQLFRLIRFNTIFCTNNWKIFRLYQKELVLFDPKKSIVKIKIENQIFCFRFVFKYLSLLLFMLSVLEFKFCYRFFFIVENCHTACHVDKKCLVISFIELCVHVTDMWAYRRCLRYFFKQMWWIWRKLNTYIRD